MNRNYFWMMLLGLSMTINSYGQNVYLVLGLNDCAACTVGFQALFNEKISNPPTILIDSTHQIEYVDAYLSENGFPKKYVESVVVNQSLYDSLSQACNLQSGFVAIESNTGIDCIQIKQLSRNDLLKIKVACLGQVRTQKRSFLRPDGLVFSEMISLGAGWDKNSHVLIDYQLNKFVSFQFSASDQSRMDVKVLKNQSLEGLSFAKSLLHESRDSLEYVTNYSRLKNLKKDHPMFRTAMLHDGSLFVGGEFPSLISYGKSKGSNSGNSSLVLYPYFFLSEIDTLLNLTNPFLIADPKKKQLDIDQNLSPIFLGNSKLLVPVFSNKRYGPRFAEYEIDSAAKVISCTKIFPLKLDDEFPKQWKNLLFFNYTISEDRLVTLNTIPCFLSRDFSCLSVLPGLSDEITLNDDESSGHFGTNFRNLASRRRGDLIETLYELNDQVFWGAFDANKPGKWLRKEKLSPAPHVRGNAVFLELGEVLFVDDKGDIQLWKLFEQ